MTQETYVENLKEVINNKKRIETGLNIKLTNKGKNVFATGKAENEFTALEVLQAINLGFSALHALQLKDENIILQTLNIKELTKRNDLERVRARIIGTHGRTLQTLSKLTNCNLSLHDNQIGIIGQAEEMDDAIQSVTSLVQGSKQGNVYGRLERHRKKKNTEPDPLDMEESVN
jgi:KH domain-containing protein|tara:strand:+ start:405 stop:926 length:522 start_codon:yes stop_codon:yes gene_type:complete